MMGGGFFGSGASSTNQTSSSSEVGQQLNEASGSNAFGWGNISAGGKNSRVDLTTNIVATDNGAIKAALDMAGKVLSSQNNSQAVNYDIYDKTVELAYGGLKESGNILDAAARESSALAIDLFNGAASAVSNSNRDNVNLTHDLFNGATTAVSNAARDSVGLVWDVFKTGSDVVANSGRDAASANAAFLGKIENWSELVDSSAREVMRTAERQTGTALDFALREGNANRSLLADANRMMGNLFDSTNRGLLSFAVDTNNKSQQMQNEAVKQIAASSAFANNATTKAMDMIFESSKSAEERVITSSTKWLIGGLIAIVGVFVIAPKFGIKAA